MNIINKNILRFKLFKEKTNKNLEKLLNNIMKQKIFYVYVPSNQRILIKISKVKIKPFC